MKRILLLLSLFSIFVFVVFLSIEPIILYLAKNKLENIFIDSKVSIGGWGLRPVGLITFSDIEIEKKSTYNFKIRELKLYYNLRSLFKGEVQGEFNIKEARYNKIKLEDIKSNVRLKGRTLSLDSLSAKTLEGEVQGDLSLNFNKNIEYRLNLKALNLSLETFVKDFNMGERFQMSGRIGGDLNLSGRDFYIDYLSGNFYSYEPGGRLTIKDKRFLKTIAKNTKQSLDILVKAFEDYHYTTGSIRLSLEEDNLILNIALDGEAGKRNLTITVHELFKK